jgi:hypothetical protein
MFLFLFGTKLYSPKMNLLMLHSWFYEMNSIEELLFTYKGITFRSPGQSYFAPLIDYLIKIPFQRRYFVSQAFVIVSQLRLALGPLRIRRSECMPKKGWSPMH